MNPEELIIFGRVITVGRNNFSSTGLNCFVYIQNKKENMTMSVMHYKVTTLCVQSGFPLTSSNQNSLSIVTECLTGLLFHFYKQWPQ